MGGLTPLVQSRPAGGGAAFACSDLAACSIASLGTKDHDLLDGLGDDDHSIYALLSGRSGGQLFKGGLAASEHLTLQSTAHATRGYVRAQDDLQLQSNVLRGSDGVARVTLAASSPHVKLGDYVRVDQRLGIATDPLVTKGLTMRPALANLTDNAALIDLSPSATSLAGAVGNLDGLHSDAMFGIRGYNVGRVAGLYFLGFVSQGVGDTLSELEAVYARVGNQATYGVIPRAHGVLVAQPAWYGDTYPTEYYGLRVIAPWTYGAGTTAVGILCEEPFYAAGNYTAWLGAPLSGTPRLRLDAGTPLNGQTMLNLAYDAALNMGRVQYTVPGTGPLAGLRVMHLV